MRQCMKTTITAPGAHRNLINSKYYCLAEKYPGSVLSPLFLHQPGKSELKNIKLQNTKEICENWGNWAETPPHPPGFYSDQKQPCPRVWFWFRTKDSSQLALCPLNGDILYVCSV